MIPDSREFRIKTTPIAIKFIPEIIETNAFRIHNYHIRLSACTRGVVG